MTSTANTDVGEEEYHFLYNPWRKAIVVNQASIPEGQLGLFLTRPLYAPLLFPNVSSDARDHCANERTFLSWLRFSVYLAIVSAAIFINFHLKLRPSRLEERVSQPLGYLFWFLSLICLASGLSNYIRTVAKYAHRDAIVQHGMKTQVVVSVVTVAIIAACGIFLGSESQSGKPR